MSVAATLGYFAAVQTLPLAEALAIYFIYPLVITTLPPLMLGAAPGIRRWAAVAAGFAGALMVMSAALPFDWQPPDGAAIQLFLLIGLISVLGHFLLTCAYDHAPASVLAPFTYSEIVSATLLGYAISHDLPGTATWAGGAVIIVSGTFIAYREPKFEQTAQTDQEGPKIKLQSARASQSSIFLHLEN